MKSTCHPSLYAYFVRVPFSALLLAKQKTHTHTNHQGTGTPPEQLYTHESLCRGSLLTRKIALHVLLYAAVSAPTLRRFEQCPEEMLGSFSR